MDFSYIHLFRLYFNKTTRHVRSIGNIFALQNTFQHEQCAPSFPVGEDGEERRLGEVTRA